LRSRWNALIVAVYVALSTSVLGFMAVNMGGPCLGLPFTASPCRTVSVEFRDASGLLHSNDLRMSGIKVGEVTAGVIDGEAPFGGDSVSVASGLPGGRFRDEGIGVRDAAVQALVAEDLQRHVKVPSRRQ